MINKKFKIIFVLFLLLINCSSENYKIKKLFLRHNNLISNKKKFYYSKLNTLFVQMCENEDFNGSFLVAKNNEIVYKNCNGYANFETKDTINFNTAFQLASVSKQFTATAIIMLKLQQKLNYDDKITKYFLDFPYKNITIRDLLNHTSGLPNYVKLEFKDNLNNNISNQILYNYYVEHKPDLNFDSGTKFEYSNTNYAFLALLVEKITNQSFEEYLNKTFFVPLKMKNTFLYNKKMLNSLKTQGYYQKWSFAPQNMFDNIYGDKEIFTTTEDLFVWDSALYDNSFINNKEFSEIFETTDYKEYKFGWVVINISNYGKIIFHTGHWSGYNALFLRDISHKNTIIVLCNVINNDIYNKVTQILNILENNLITNEIKIY